MERVLPGELRISNVHRYFPIIPTQTEKTKILIKLRKLQVILNVTGMKVIIWIQYRKIV